MKIYPECIPCLLNRVIYEATLVDPAMAHSAVRAAINVMHEKYREGMISVELASPVHAAVYDVLGTDDPYKDLKAEANRTAFNLRNVVEDYINGFETGSVTDRLRACMKVTVIGNILDFGITGAAGSPAELEEKIKYYLQEELGWDDTERIHELLKDGGKHVFYLTDNAGEVVYDYYLLRCLKEEYDTKTTVLVKGAPILSDATYEDAIEFHLDDYAVIGTTGSAYVGINLEHLDPDVRKGLMEADLIISKGMANFEALSDSGIGPIAYLMRTKCKPVAESVGAPRDTSIIKLV